MARFSVEVRKRRAIKGWIVIGSWRRFWRCWGWPLDKLGVTAVGAGVSVGVFGAVLGVFGVAAGQVTVAGPQVVTRGGVVSGVVSGDVVSFKGIPYAAAPVGNLRWAAPQAAAPWSGVRSGDDFGASCPQAATLDFIAPGSRAATTSEDCLTLSVWTPVQHEHPLPVMVFIHGGGNDTGTGSTLLFTGRSFARDGAVLVTFNYRLGVLGFFAPDAHGTNVDFALLDQVAALQWVHANIAAFGGDPSNVTLFGESAGGLDTLLLAGAPAARGLMTRAISESGDFPWDPASTYVQAHAQTRDELGALGLAKDSSMEALRALPVARLIRPGVGAIDPAVDGDVLVTPDPVARIRAITVPLMIGTNDGEGSLLGDGVLPSTVVKALPAADYARLTENARAAGADDDAIARQLFGDAYFAAPAWWIAGLLHDEGRTVYCYRFDYVLSLLRARRQSATHGSELPYVFDSYRDLRPLSDTDRALIAMMHASWLAFAKTGVPSAPNLPTWPPCDPSSGRMMVFDASPSVRAIDATRLDLFVRDLAPRSP